MSSYEDYRDFILEKLDERALLGQLAEEARGLSQAALKLIRVKELSNNVAPRTEQEVTQNLVEEILDCNLIMSLLYRKDRKLVTSMPKINKHKRWAERWGYKD